MEIELYDKSEVESNILQIEKEYKYIPGIGHKLGRYMLSDNILERMKKLTDRSIEINKEIGFTFCANEDFNITNSSQFIPISPGETCVGDECELIRQNCPQDKINIGGFHTHPPDNVPHMTYADANLAYENGIECIGTHKEISCFIRKSDYANEQIQKTLNSLYDKITKLNEQVELHSEKMDKENYIDHTRKFLRDNFKETKIE